MTVRCRGRRSAAVAVLGRQGGDLAGDRLTLCTLGATLPAGGVLLVSVPVGPEAQTVQGERRYGGRELASLLEGFTVLEAFGYRRNALRWASRACHVGLVLRPGSDGETLGVHPPPGRGRGPVRVGGGIRTQPVFEARVLPLVESLGAPGEVVVLDVPDIDTPLAARIGTSDLHALNEVLLAGDYDFDLPRLEPRLVIDGGANVGYASVLFATRWPRARVIAVEPESSNVAMLRRNVSHLPNVEVVPAALWPRSGWLRIANPQAAAWSVRVVEAAHGPGPAVRATTVSELLASCGASVIDLLKLDIEGAERELFAQGADEWLARVLIIELHDERPGTTETFHRAVERHGFRVLERRKGRYATNLCLHRARMAEADPTPGR